MKTLIFLIAATGMMVGQTSVSEHKKWIDSWINSACTDGTEHLDYNVRHEVLAHCVDGKWVAGPAPGEQMRLEARIAALEKRVKELEEIGASDEEPADILCFGTANWHRCARSNLGGSGESGDNKSYVAPPLIQVTVRDCKGATVLVWKDINKTVPLPNPFFADTPNPSFTTNGGCIQVFTEFVHPQIRALGLGPTPGEDH